MENILPMVLDGHIFSERHLRAEPAGMCANLIAPAASPFLYLLFVLFRLGYARCGDFLPPMCLWIMHPAGCRWWGRRRCRLWRGNRQRAQVVSRLSWPVRGIDGRSIWHRHGSHYRPDCQDDRQFRLSTHICGVGFYSGNYSSSLRLISGEAT